MTTALSCRQYDTRMHVAMMVDACLNTINGRIIFHNCQTGNTASRYWNMFSDNTTDYMKMWGRIEHYHGHWGWNHMADYQIDRDWQHARQHGMCINGIDVPAQQFVASQIRWERNGWLCYEYKRSKRRSAFAPFLRVAAIV